MRGGALCSALECLPVCLKRSFWGMVWQWWEKGKSGLQLAWCARVRRRGWCFGILCSAKTFTTTSPTSAWDGRRRMNKGYNPGIFKMSVTTILILKYVRATVGSDRRGKYTIGYTTHGQGCRKQGIQGETKSSTEKEEMISKKVYGS